MIAETTTIQPASGETKKKLIFDCEKILLARETITIPEFEQVNEILVQLLGGNHHDGEYGNIITPWLVDRGEHERAIQLIKSLNPLTPNTRVFVGPEWMALPKEQANLVQAHLTDPYLNEHVGISYTQESNPVVTNTLTLVHPPKYKPRRIASYVSGESLPLPEALPIGERTYHHIMHSALSRRMFYAFLRQQHC